MSTSSEGREATGIGHCLLSAGCLGNSDNCKFAEAALESLSLLHSRELEGRTVRLVLQSVKSDTSAAACYFEKKKVERKLCAVNSVFSFILI